jgi:hypothetical protein
MIGVGSQSVDGFLPVAGKGEGQRREPKLCEGWNCGKMFFRAVPASARSGETLCPACREKALAASRGRRPARIK